MGMVGASTSRGQLLVAIALSGAAFGGLGWWLGNSAPEDSVANRSQSEEQLSRRGSVIEIVERTKDGGERVVYVEGEDEDGADGRSAPQRPSYDDIDPDEDYAKYGDGPSAGAKSLAEVEQEYLEAACLEVGTKNCTSDLQCCGDSVCRPPPGSISGIFSCR